MYDIGENGDCSVDALICDNTADLVTAFGQWPHVKASFATKFVNADLLALDPRGGTRIRFSIVPPADARLLDLRTSAVADRIAAAADFAEAGYQAHFNLSPVVLRPGWQDDWTELLRQVDDVVPQRVKQQAAAEVIMLTHNEHLHQVNLGWHPRAEDLLGQPELQQGKRSQNGAANVRYRNPIKAESRAHPARTPQYPCAVAAGALRVLRPTAALALRGQGSFAVSWTPAPQGPGLQATPAQHEGADR